MRAVFQTRAGRSIYPASGTGAWEAALVNTLSPGDTVLMSETGHSPRCGRRWPTSSASSRSSWPATGASGADPRGDRGAPAATTRRTRSRRCASCTTRPRPASRATSRAVRQRDRRAPSIRRCCWSTRSRRWARSTIATTNGASTSRSAGSQKGLMLPPGLSFNAVSEKALAASKNAKLPRVVLGLGRDARGQRQRLFSLHAGDQPALRPARGAATCCSRKGSTNVFARHERHAEATRRAVRAWGLEILCQRSRGLFAAR